MARTPYSQNSYVGGAPAALLYTGVASGITTISITGTNSSWGSLGSVGGFNLALNYGQPTEEKVFCPAGSYNWSSGFVTITGTTRGIDGTTQQLQQGGVSVVPILTAIDLTEANLLVSQTLLNVTTSSGQSLISNGTGISYGYSAIGSGTIFPSPIIRGGTTSGVVSTSSTLLYPVLQGGIENTYITGTNPTTTTTITLSSGSVWYFNTAATNAGPWTFNFTNSGTLNSLLSIGQSATTSIIVTQGATPNSYYANAIQVDGIGQTVYWQNAITPVSGLAASALDIYSITAIKTANNSFTVLASQTKF